MTCWTILDTHTFGEALYLNYAASYQTFGIAMRGAVRFEVPFPREYRRVWFCGSNASIGDQTTLR